MALRSVYFRVPDDLIIFFLCDMTLLEVLGRLILELAAVVALQDSGGGLRRKNIDERERHASVCLVEEWPGVLCLGWCRIPAIRDLSSAEDRAKQKCFWQGATARQVGSGASEGSGAGNVGATGSSKCT